MTAHRHYAPRVITMGLPDAFKPDPAPALSSQMLDAGRMLVDRTTRGEYVDLDEDQQSDLRCLGRQIIGWADRVETMERERPAPRRPGRLRLWWRRVRLG